MGVRATVQLTPRLPRAGAFLNIHSPDLQCSSPARQEIVLAFQGVSLLLGLVGEVRRTHQGVKLKHSSVSCDRQSTCQAAFLPEGLYQRCPTLTAAGLSTSLSDKPCPW